MLNENSQILRYNLKIGWLEGLSHQLNKRYFFTILMGIFLAVFHYKIISLYKLQSALIWRSLGGNACKFLLIKER